MLKRSMSIIMALFLLLNTQTGMVFADTPDDESIDNASGEVVPEQSEMKKPEESPAVKNDVPVAAPDIAKVDPPAESTSPDVVDPPVESSNPTKEKDPVVPVTQEETTPQADEKKNAAPDVKEPEKQNQASPEVVEPTTTKETEQKELKAEVETVNVSRPALFSGNLTQYEDFVYEPDGDGIRITKYLGEETGELIVPAEIEGKPVTAIGDSAFSQCEASSIIIPSTVTAIGEGAFAVCKFQSFSIPASVRSIGKRAFSLCWQLSSIVIPASVSSIGRSPFSACTSLQSITVEKGNTNYSSLNGSLIETSTMKLISYPYGTIIGDTVNIPAGVKIIGMDAFSGASCKDVVIPETVEKIEQDAFINSSLTSLIIPGSVKTVGSTAFAGSLSLQTVTLNDGVESIGYSAFANCTDLEFISIPDSVTSIADDAFDQDYKLFISANAGSYAAQYAKDHNINTRLKYEDFVYE
ncbi:MAG: leucine-rich repeat protein, partial [Oscillospiraceae bacterium]|nr:leucine-rich repeat protein [Oscillospiraceae bacterium]